MSHPIPGHTYGENEKEGGEDATPEEARRSFRRPQKDDPYNSIVVRPFFEARAEESREDYQRHSD